MGCYQSKTKEAYNPHTNVILSNKKRFSSKKIVVFRYYHVSVKREINPINKMSLLLVRFPLKDYLC